MSSWHVIQLFRCLLKWPLTHSFFPCWIIFLCNSCCQEAKYIFYMYFTWAPDLESIIDECEDFSKFYWHLIFQQLSLPLLPLLSMLPSYFVSNHSPYLYFPLFRSLYHMISRKIFLSYHIVLHFCSVIIYSVSSRSFTVKSTISTVFSPLVSLSWFLSF